MKTFYDIKEQDRAISILQKAYLNKSIAQAYLFDGMSGIGKSLIARVFIKLINCDNPTSTFNPCNECKNCINIDNDKFIDLIHIKPSSSKDVIKIESIRDIEEKIAYSSYAGKFRVILIEDADQMNISSANALLKTLEEPPEQTIFILTVSKLSRLPDTISSRCQKILFSPLSKEFIYSKLKQEYKNIEDDDLKITASISLGSMTMAYSIISNQILDYRKEFINTLFSQSKTKLVKTIEYIKVLIKKFKGDDFYFLSFFLEILRSVLRDALLYSSKLSKQMLFNFDILDIIERLSQKNHDVLIKEIDKIKELQNQIF